MSLIGTGTPVGRPAGVGDGKGNDDSPDVAILDEMRRRFEHVCSVDEINRENYVRSTKISSSNDQWDELVKKRRGSDRPALTFNMLNLVVKQIIGDYRQNKMQIKVLPSGGPATEDIADIWGGIIRNIETDSNADEAYTNALECACRGNIGYIRILPKYVSDDTFSQKLVIQPIKNPLTVYVDPLAKLRTRSDAEYMFVSEMVSKDEFRRMYPKAEEMGWDIVDLNSDGAGDWGNDNEIRIMEYFTKKRIEARLVAFDNGACIQIDDDKEIEALEQIGIKPVKERTAERINIQWRKCNASHILEERTFKTKYIPIIPVLGEEVNIEGKTMLRSAVYYGVDAQHSYNYERSTAVENSALSAKAPWKVTHKMIEMWRDLWDKANITPQPYLIYTPDPSVPNGPERIEPPTPSTAAMQNSQAASLDIQRTTGVFNSQVGEQTNVQSGVGLSEQQSQGQTSTFIFLDNLKAGIEQCGRVLVDWSPEYLDTDQVIRTINSEDDIEMQHINQKQENPLLGVTEVLNDIRVGEYDVICTAGKAFASRRREAVDSMLKFAQHFPQQAPLIADLMIKNMDIPGGDVMAERINRSLPPQITTDPDSPEGQQAAKQAQQKQQQQEQMQMQLVQGKLKAEEGKNQASVIKSQADVQKSNAEVVKAKSDIEIAKIEAHSAQIESTATMLDAHRQAAEPKEAAKPEQHDDEIKKMLTALAGHMVASHKQLSERMDNHEKILAAPVEATYDKSGKIVGSRKVLPNAPA